MTRTRRAVIGKQTPAKGTTCSASKRWRPKYGQMYFTIGMSGGIVELEWETDEVDLRKLELFGCHRSMAGGG